MPRAKLTVTLPPMAWIGEVSREYPQHTFRVLAALPREDTGVGLVELTGPALPEVVDTIDSFEAVLSLEILGKSPDRLVIQFETTEPLLLFSVQESGVPLEPPVEIEDGEASVEVTASQERLSTFATQLEQFGMQFDVRSVHRSVQSSDEVLTGKQRDLLTAAVVEGYYDTPRECTLTELADHVDMAKSTVSEMLHRAEETVVKEFVTDLEDDLLAESSS